MLGPTADLPDPKLSDEPGRQASLDRYNVLDTGPEPSFEAITSLVRDLLGVPICAVSLIDRDRQWFKSHPGLGVSETPRSMSFCNHAIRGRDVMAVEDATRDARFADNPLVTGDPSIRSYAGAPLTTSDGYNLGALCAIDREPREFTAEQLNLLQRFAALVMEQLELRTLAHEDSLTGALTRRAFCSLAEQAVRQSERDGTPSTLVMFDVDHFKSINDRFGHPSGDEVLKAISSTALSMLRPSDSLGRLGGEEFAVLMAGSTREAAFAWAERLRKTIGTLDVLNGVKVTASFGIAELPAENVDSWMERADTALYAAKRGGRDCCEVATSLEEIS